MQLSTGRQTGGASSAAVLGEEGTSVPPVHQCFLTNLNSQDTKSASSGLGRTNSSPPAARWSAAETAADGHRPPRVVFVIGPTGVGKSRLGIDICEALKRRGVAAEIISADSMQVYKGCDIATAKATEEERQRIPHHLLDVCTPQEAFTAADYLKSAKAVIHTLTSEGKLPVVVGGTQLYIELLLWESAVDLDEAEKTARPPNSSAFAPSALNHMTDEDLMGLLRKLDSKRAQQLHPHDRRRIIRSIEFLLQVSTLYGVPHSELMRRKGGGRLRYDPCILWLDLRDRAALERRLRARLSEMCENGLLDEVKWLLSLLKPNEQEASREGQSSSADSESDAGGGVCLGAADTPRRGVLQGIGYKEFFPLMLHEAFAGEDCRRSGELGGPRSLNDCVDLVVLRSLQFARQQRKWIKNKFLIRRKNLPLYFIETTDEAVAAWADRVCGPAVQIVEKFLAGYPFSEDDIYAAARCLPEAVQLRPEAEANGDESDAGGSNE
ncbi:hypothetical protein Efla_000236 [Eimeria flavescens]